MLAEASLELVDALAEISACGLYIAGGPAMGPGCSSPDQARWESL